MEIPISKLSHMLCKELFSFVDEKRCSGCKICLSLCPFDVISFDEEKRAAKIDEAMCKDCGVCAAGCPSGAINARHFTDEEIMSRIERLLVEETREREWVWPLKLPKSTNCA